MATHVKLNCPYRFNSVGSRHPHLPATELFRAIFSADAVDMDPAGKISF